MEEESPVDDRHHDGRWHPRTWGLRTRISAVLVLPAVVALTLAGVRIQPELAQAGALSAIRDQVPVLRYTTELANLVGVEMVANGADPAGRAPAAQAADVDAKAAALQGEADFAQIDPGGLRDLRSALSRLGGLHAPTAGDGDVVSETSTYHDIIYSLSTVLPSVVSAAGNNNLNATATATASLIRLRADLTRELTLLRYAMRYPADRAALVAASQAATEVALNSGQAVHVIPSSATSRFTAATSSATNRQAALEKALITGRGADLPSIIAPIDTEIGALGDLVAELADALSNDVTALTNQSRSDALRDTAVTLGALLGALAVALLVARSLVNPVHRLHSAAMDVAHHRLPETIERVRSGEHVDWRSVEPVPVRTGEEIGQLARAFDEMHHQAVRLAGEQAELRKQVSEMFMTLSRRSQSLVETQLSVIEDLEADEADPRRLDRLFRIDHIATRLRRNGENLQVLAGGSPVRQDRGPVSTVELLRAATSEVTDYRRITVGNAPGGAVLAQAAADVVHILAELLENATRFSSPAEKVVLTADRGSDGGLLIEVVDMGLGMAVEDVATANTRLATADAVSPETTRRMGLFVVGRLAAPLGVTVRLRRTMDQPTRSGITASVYVPGDLVVAGGVAIAAAPVHAALSAADATGTVVNGGVIVDEPRWPLHEPGDDDILVPVRTPIFDQLVSGWFVERPGPEKWATPTDETRRAAEKAVRPPAQTTTTAVGLPVRKPGVRLAPGTAAPRQATPPPTGFRDPAAIRNNLARHYGGMQAARLRTSGAESADEGKTESR